MSVTYRLIAVVVFSAAHIQASDLSYTHVDISYVRTEIDVGPGDVDGDGIELGGSFALDDQFHLIAGYSNQDFDSVDVSVLELGGGFHRPINNDIDFVGTLSYLSLDVDTAFGDGDDDGFGIGLGLRGTVQPGFEWEGGIDLVDIGDFDTSFRIDGRYQLNDTVWVTGGLTLDDDGNGIRIGLRADLSQRSKRWQSQRRRGSTQTQNAN